jgi:hypothetical protein
MGTDQEEVAANFANEHESKTKKRIRVFRVDSRLILLANLVANGFG